MYSGHQSVIFNLNGGYIHVYPHAVSPLRCDGCRVNEQLGWRSVLCWIGQSPTDAGLSRQHPVIDIALMRLPSLAGRKNHIKPW